MTNEAADFATSLGIPRAIVTRMVETPPDRVSALTNSDLIAMGVTILPDVQMRTKR